MTSLAHATKTTSIARPLKTLVPLIAQEITRGNTVAAEHHARAGELLIEAREQIPGFRWASWLSKNFGIKPRTAETWMDMAERAALLPNGRIPPGTTQDELLGRKTSAERRQEPASRPVREFTRHVDVEDVGQQRQPRVEETRLARGKSRSI